MELKQDVKNQFHLEIPSYSENVQFARTAVALFASQLEFNLDDLDDLKVAVSEAVSNAVIHAYRKTVGLVSISGTLYDDAVEIVIEDAGCGIADLDRARQATFSTAPDRMGLGLTFIEELMDKVKIESEANRGTHVSMTKVLSPVKAGK